MFKDLVLIPSAPPLYYRDLTPLSSVEVGSGGPRDGTG